MTIYWGVRPLKSLEHDNTEDICENAMELAKVKKYVEQGDVVVLTAGIPSPYCHAPETSAVWLPSIWTFFLKFFRSVWFQESPVSVLNWKPPLQLHPKQLASEYTLHSDLQQQVRRNIQWHWIHRSLNDHTPSQASPHNLSAALYFQWYEPSFRSVTVTLRQLLQQPRCWIPWFGIHVLQEPR